FRKSILRLRQTRKRDLTAPISETRISPLKKKALLPPKSPASLPQRLPGPHKWPAIRSAAAGLAFRPYPPATESALFRTPAVCLAVIARTAPSSDRASATSG